ncbi:kelch repeat protein-like protein [Lizonia empirigonia]|nr:kelch repeat protein-like protein [Lizonia empirigonia]
MEQVRPQPAAARGRRRSIFTEVGLIDEHTISRERSPAPVLITEQALRQVRPLPTVRFRSTNSVFGGNDGIDKDYDSDWESVEDEESQPSSTSFITHSISNSRLYRAGLFTVVLALMLPIIQMMSIAPLGVYGGSIPRASITSIEERSTLVERADSQTDVCKRWSGQSAIVNGTLYMYGFRTTTDAQQKTDTWTNDFLTLDLTKSWQISNPSLTGMPQPSGPPAISLGYLYSSHNSLWLYGGQYSDSPKVEPGPNSVWEYNIASQSWAEHKDPKSSAGTNAEGDGQSIQRAAEGAGFGVTTLGRGWYFGGHLDDFTTEGWSNQIARVYLKSLLEITFPGHSNDAVESLKDGKTAETDPVYRNITTGGIQDTGSFPERADGVLTYVPGFGSEGLLIGFTGGDNDTFAQMNVIDVYDIAESTWYKQSTSGTMPPYRVNPCAVVGAAPDGSSYNIYMFGGQNLQPYGNQTQKDDMWILSVPSFTWIQVDQDSQSVPPARAGHSCHVWDGQMIVIGGYVGTELSCDSPGIYVFNMSSLSWSDQFTSLTGGKATQDYTGEGSIGNPLGQQANQRGFNASAGVEGSYGYRVPDAVQKVIGGAATGGATLTAPVQTPTAGPLVTGRAITYTLTGPNGASYTEIIASSGDSGDSGPNIAAIVAGVVAGIFAVIAAYFAFCAWIYRKQVQMWKQHAAIVSAASEKRDTTFTSSRISSERAPGTAGGVMAGSFDIQRRSGENTSYGGAGAANWERRSSVGSITEDLLDGQEPSFWGTRGVLLNPRRSLRVINRD